MTTEGALEETTWPSPADPPRSFGRALMLSICHHPDHRRVGERARLVSPGEGSACEISRLRPDFRTADGRHTGALVDPHLSRTPLLVLADGAGGVLLRWTGKGAAVLVAGKPLAEARSFSAHEIEDGITIELARRVVLLLHSATEESDAAPKYGLIGESAALQRVRAEILHIAGLSLPVLLRGESGTGKELVARAIHAASPRAARPYVCVNLAALNPQTAVAELFGHARGAFTGAVRARDGYFREADGGTLFLDEIGEAPIEVQVMLLRALETGEIQPLGGGASRHVDIRLIAATDANLEAAVLRGSFRLSLLHRLAGYEIWLPPLRRRRDDIPLLLLHFLRVELASAEGSSPQGGGALLPADIVAALLRYEWPGNVRQLHNVARQLVALSFSGRDPRSSAPLARVLAAVGERSAEPVPELPPGAPVRVPARAGSAAISESMLIAALQHNRWAIDATARYLGISKTSLYALIERSDQIKKARDLPRETLLAAFERCGGDLQRMSEELRVSFRGLQLRMRELGGEAGGSPRPDAADPRVTPRSR